MGKCPSEYNSWPDLAGSSRLYAMCLEERQTQICFWPKVEQERFGFFMVVQTSLFDVPVRSTAHAERQAKDEGIAYAVAAMPDKGYDMDEMRRWARWFVHSNQSMRLIGVPNVVWADVVREKFDIKPLAGRGNNFMGAIFHQDFEWTGEWYKSKTSGSHGNLVRLWKLK